MTAIAKSTAHSIVEASPRSKFIAGAIVILYAVIAILPLLWIGATAFKSQSDAIAYPPKVIFQPTLEGYVNLFTVRTRQTQDFIAKLPPATTWYDRLVRQHDMVIAGPSKVVPRFVNSLIIGFGSTFLAVFLGTLAAYAFSRFRIPFADDLLFFILSTRMMPPVAVAIPIYLMYRQLNLTDTKLGMILLYTAVNVSLAVWLLKGFIDEIPREYEEAALVDGYTRLQALAQGRAAAGGDRHRGDRDLLPDLLLERICLRRAADQRRRADHAAVHPVHHRRGRSGLAGGRGRDHALRGPDRPVHDPVAQAPVARNNLWSGTQMKDAVIGKSRNVALVPARTLGGVCHGLDRGRHRACWCSPGRSISTAIRS